MFRLSHGQGSDPRSLVAVLDLVGFCDKNHLEWSPHTTADQPLDQRLPLLCGHVPIHCLLEREEREISRHDVSHGPFSVSLLTGDHWL